MTTTETTVTGGTVATLICIPILLLILGAGLVWALRYARRNHDTGNDGEEFAAKILAAALGVIMGITLLATWWGMYPWRWEYHEWRPVSGTVASVDSRLNRTDSGMEDKFVVTFEGSRQQYGVLDTRAATLRCGDRLSITCVRRWQWSGTHGYDCAFVDMERPTTR